MNWPRFFLQEVLVCVNLSRLLAYKLDTDSLFSLR
jgi:hypothetical protein